MKIGFISGLAAAGLICLGITAAPQLVAALPSPSGLSIGAEAVAPLATPVRKWNRVKIQRQELEGQKLEP